LYTILFKNYFSVEDVVPANSAAHCNELADNSGNPNLNRKPNNHRRKCDIETK